VFESSLDVETICADKQRSNHVCDGNVNWRTPAESDAIAHNPVR